MLDHHVSKAILGEVFNYFTNQEEQIEAVAKLQNFFSQPFANSEVVGGAARLKIALLGSGYTSNFPMVFLVGLVLAPVVCQPISSKDSNPSAEDRSRTREINPGLLQGPGLLAWERIGLMRWVEHYHSDNSSPHPGLPCNHNFECFIY